jgi:hypothetical protein
MFFLVVKIPYVVYAGAHMQAGQDRNIQCCVHQYFDNIFIRVLLMLVGYRSQSPGLKVV